MTGIRAIGWNIAWLNKFLQMSREKGRIGIVGHDGIHSVNWGIKDLSAAQENRKRISFTVWPHVTTEQAEFTKYFHHLGTPTFAISGQSSLAEIESDFTKIQEKLRNDYLAMFILCDPEGLLREPFQLLEIEARQRQGLGIPPIHNFAAHKAGEGMTWLNPEAGLLQLTAYTSAADLSKSLSWAQKTQQKSVQTHHV